MLKRRLFERVRRHGTTPLKTARPQSSPDPGLMTLAISVVSVVALSLAKDVLLPITLALILSFLLAPVVGLLGRMRVPRIPAVLLAVTFGLSVILLIGALIGVQIAGMSADIPRYAAAFERKVEGVRLYGNTELARLAQVFGRGSERGDNPPGNGRDERRPSHVPASANSSSDEADPFVIARRILQPTLNPVADTLIIVIISVFMLAQRRDLRDRITWLFGAGDLRKTTLAMDEAGRLLGHYFLAQFAINTTFGIVITTGLYLIGVPSPALWGVVAALLRFIPYVGSLMGFALPMAVAFAVSPGWTMMAWIAGLFAAAEGLTGQVLEPMTYGRSAGLSPTAVVVAAIFWTWIWGPVGLILSTPLTLCLVVVGRYVERFRFLEVLLGDRPALSPSQSFYQRVLADTLDDVQEQADALLKTLSLTEYYDQVAIEGLRLASADIECGAIARPQIERIVRNVQALVGKFALHVDVPTKPSFANSNLYQPVVSHRMPNKSEEPELVDAPPIVCLSGGGCLDEAATLILAQLLLRRGLRVSVVAYDAASREAIGSLKPDGVKAVCLTSLEIAGSSSRLHYLNRRVRNRWPEAKIVVGLWTRDDEILTDERMKAVVGADFYATSLKDVLTRCPL